jgi:NAD(P)-dependent dehydrogenase (short-subunit alcohol dehydrogenase family)
MACEADVSDPGGVEAMFEAARERFGIVDIVVNSAGGPWKPQDITEISPDHLRAVLAREIESTYYLLRSALPLMRFRGWGRFISIGGHMADDWRFGPPDAPLDYPLGKAARHWLTRTLAPRELPHGITINAIAPGPTARFTFEQAVESARRGGAPPRSTGPNDPVPADFRVRGASDNTPQHIAELVAFLCSEEAARVSGAVIPLPGSHAV